MSATEVTTINLDDPDFQEQQIYDPEQDIDQRQPPPEIDLQGNVVDYLFRLTIGDNKQGEKKPFARQTKKGTKYLALIVKAQVVAEGQPFDKAFVQFPFSSVSTMIFNGTNSMANLARVLGNPMPANLSQLDQAAYIVSLLETEPLVPGQLEWRTYCSNCETDIHSLEGERNWPEKKDEDGNVVGHKSVAKCPTCNNELSASVQIKKLHNVK